MYVFSLRNFNLLGSLKFDPLETSCVHYLFWVYYNNNHYCYYCYYYYYYNNYYYHNINIYIYIYVYLYIYVPLWFLVKMSRAPFFGLDHNGPVTNMMVTK